MENLKEKKDLIEIQNIGEKLMIKNYYMRQEENIYLI